MPPTSWGLKASAKLIEAVQTTPAATAAQLFPDAAQANRSIFYRDGRAATVSEVYANLTRSAGPAAPVQAEAPLQDGGFIQYASARREDRQQQQDALVSMILQGTQPSDQVGGRRPAGRLAVHQRDAQSPVRQPQQLGRHRPVRPLQRLGDLDGLEGLCDEFRTRHAFARVIETHGSGDVDHRQARMHGARVAGHFEAIQARPKVDVGHQSRQVFLPVDRFKRGGSGVCAVSTLKPSPLEKFLRIQAQDQVVVYE